MFATHVQLLRTASTQIPLDATYLLRTNSYQEHMLWKIVDVAVTPNRNFNAELSASMLTVENAYSALMIHIPADKCSFQIQISFMVNEAHAIMVCHLLE